MNGLQRRYTRDSDDVRVPEWADEYAVGDEITVQTDGMDDPVTLTVLGWSTKRPNEGFPVVSADVLTAKTGITGTNAARELAVERDNVVEVDDD